MTIEPKMLQRIVEGALLAAGKPLSVQALAELFEEEMRPASDEILAALQDIQSDHRDRGFELKEVASGWRFQVVQDVATWVARLWEERPKKYSRALLETLALIAYRQPITRGDIEEIRGVAVSSDIIKTLLEREWVRVVGHKDVPGRPAMYATTRRFLDYFNLKNLDELPTLAEIRDLDTLNRELELDAPAPVAVEPGTDRSAEQASAGATVLAEHLGEAERAELEALDEELSSAAQGDEVEVAELDAAGRDDLRAEADADLSDTVH